MLTQARLKEVLHYDPATGVFTALVAGPNRPVGSVVGSKNGKGYLLAYIDGAAHTLGRLAWLYMTGVHADGLVDHKDRNRTNNAWVNLREASNAENGRNAGMSKRNTSGVKGVYWYARHQKWNAQIRVDRKLLSLGYFASIDDAAAARRNAEQVHFGAFAPQA